MIQTLSLSQLNELAKQDKLVGAFKVTNADYHKGPGISKSGLDNIAKSPAHYQHALSEVREFTPAMLLGSVTHHKLLEPENFTDWFAVAPEINRRTNEGKAAWEKFQTDNANKTVVTGEVLETAERIIAKIKDHSIANGQLEGFKEVAFYWKDERTGVLCKCKPDCLGMQAQLVDLKVVSEADPGNFARKILNLRYHVQAALYLDGVRAAIDQGNVTELKFLAPRKFVFLAVESSEPHGIGVYELPIDAVELGRSKYQADLKTFLECTASGKWPTYTESVVPIQLPKYAWY